jgi:hypothetical protein
MKRNGWSLMRASAALAVVGAMAVVALTIGLLVAFGAVRTEGPYLDWAVVSAVATTVGAGVAVVATAGLILGVREFERRETEARLTRERERGRRPYLRVDVSFEAQHEANFHPPPSTHVYSADELRQGDEVRQVIGVLEPAPGDGADHLVLWVTNMHLEPLAIADRVSVRLRLAWQMTPDEPPTVRVLTIVLAYIAPQQVTTIRIGPVAETVYSFAAQVAEVSYYDLFGVRSRDAHGALEFSYHRRGGVRNGRQAQRQSLARR